MLNSAAFWVHAMCSLTPSSQTHFFPTNGLAAPCEQLIKSVQACVVSSTVSKCLQACTQLSLPIVSQDRWYILLVRQRFQHSNCGINDCGIQILHLAGRWLVQQALQTLSVSIDHMRSIDTDCNATVIISALICASDCTQRWSCTVLGSKGTQVSLPALTHILPHVCISSRFLQHLAAVLFSLIDLHRHVDTMMHMAMEGCGSPGCANMPILKTVVCHKLIGVWSSVEPLRH